MQAESPSHSSPVQAARSLYPLISAASDRIEQERRLPADIASALKESRLFRLCVPHRYAGLEAAPMDMVEAIAEVSRADGSAGWCVAIGATSGLLAGYLPDADAREIYASDPLSVAGGVFAPRGEATADGDGYRMRGRWAFASGIGHCSWLMGGCVVYENGKPALLPGGLPDSRLLIFPAASATVHDTWTVSGLCGTGSHDMEVGDLLVPRSRAISLMTDKPRLDSPLYKFPVFGCLAVGIAAVSVGLARRAIDELVAIAGGKTPTGSRRRLADRAYVQMQVAEAEAAQRTARAFLVDTVAATYEEAACDGEISVGQRAMLRLAATHSVSLSKKAVDLMYDAGGGTSIYKSSPLQRCFRDVHAASQHMMVSSSTLEVAGRVLLGLDTDASQL
ncbi:MAG TPA: acyl-CoA dehydrogenase family protein [Candidatus Binatia bacterium]